MDYVRLTKEQKRQDFLDSLALREEIKSRKIPFLYPGFLPDFWLCQGLILVGAESGRAKSTTCSNVIAGFLKASKRDAIVITLEEAADAILARTACILHKWSYMDYYHGHMSPMEMGLVDEAAIEVSQRVEIVSANEFNRVDCLEGIAAVLEAAAKDGSVGMVALDYFQCVTSSIENPEWESFRVSKELGIYLRDYGRVNAIPIVSMVQLRSASEGSSMAERISNDKTLLNHAFIAIEVKPDFANSTTEFIVHKDRMNGCTGAKVKLEYFGGRLLQQGSTRDEVRRGQGNG